MKTTLVVFVYCLNVVLGGSILALFPLAAKSHFYAFGPLLKTLAHRGNRVIVVAVGSIPPLIKSENYTHIHLEEVGKITYNLNLSEYNDESTFRGSAVIMKVFFEDFAKTDRVTLVNMLELLNDKYKFDLIMTEIFNSDLFFGFAYKYQADIIALSSSGMPPWATDRFGIPDNPSYIPFAYTSKFDQHSFFQRLSNLFSTYLLKIMYDYKYIKETDLVARKYFGENVPPLDEIIKKSSVFLVNSHYSINNMPRPLPPQVIEVAGIHLNPVKSLSQELGEFLNESEHGVIYFSFGSLLDSSTMNESTVRTFCDVFSVLPQRVLWKWGHTKMPRIPDNVKLVKWSPQRDVLAHPNIRLFISHGGMLSTIEAIDSGVPILGMPFYGDQMQNINNLVDMDAAIRLDFLNISKESLSFAVNSLLQDEKYKQNAHRLSQIFKDRPQTPLEAGVFWTEYVLRHKGAHHLRTQAVHLPLYQYLLLDVIFVLLCFTTIISLILFYSVKIVLMTFFLKNKKLKRQ